MPNSKGSTKKKPNKVCVYAMIDVSVPCCVGCVLWNPSLTFKRGKTGGYAPVHRPPPHAHCCLTEHPTRMAESYAGVYFADTAMNRTFLNRTSLWYA